MVTFDQVNERFLYCGETGLIIDRRTGAEAGRVEVNRNTSYRRISFCVMEFRGHRIAWLLFHGSWPSGQVDHVDGDGLNNRIANLRCVTHSQNQRNQRLGKRNRSGVLGVSWDSQHSSWQAHIWIDGKRKHIGRFKRLKHAAAARAAAAEANGYIR